MDTAAESDPTATTNLISNHYHCFPAILHMLPNLVLIRATQGRNQLIQLQEMKVAEHSITFQPYNSP